MHRRRKLSNHAKRIEEKLTSFFSNCHAQSECSTNAGCSQAIAARRFHAGFCSAPLGARRARRESRNLAPAPALQGPQHARMISAPGEPTVRAALFAQLRHASLPRCPENDAAERILDRIRPLRGCRPVPALGVEPPQSFEFVVGGLAITYLCVTPANLTPRSPLRSSRRRPYRPAGAARTRARPLAATLFVQNNTGLRRRDLVIAFSVPIFGWGASFPGSFYRFWREV